MGAFRKRGATANSWTGMEHMRASIACRRRIISTQNRRVINEGRTTAAHAYTHGEPGCLLERSATASGLCSFARGCLSRPDRPVQHCAGAAGLADETVG